MARYKHIDTSPRFLAVDLERLLLPGTFEHALNYLIDHQIDLSGFDSRYKNDLTGASAYPRWIRRCIRHFRKQHSSVRDAFPSPLTCRAKKVRRE